MPTEKHPNDSDLFLVRLWIEEAEGGATVWCGKVQRVVSGEMRYFRSWPNLEESLLAIMARHSAVPAQQAEEGDTEAE